MPQATKRVLFVLFSCGVLLTLAFGLVLQPPKVDIPNSPIRHDYLLHVATFLVLTVIGAALWSPAGTLAAIMVAGGGTLELVQALCGRDMSLGDWVASSAGVALGTLLFAVVARHVLPVPNLNCGTNRGRQFHGRRQR